MTAPRAVPRRPSFKVAVLVLGATAATVDDLRTEQPGAEARVVVGFRAAQAVVHVQRRDAVTVRTQDMPSAGRVRTARDENGDVTARRDQIALADERFHSRSELGRIHGHNCGSRRRD